jgi:hypothetical protein
LPPSTHGAHVGPEATETYTRETEYDHRSVSEGWVRERAVLVIELRGDQASRIESIEYEVIEVLK